MSLLKPSTKNNPYNLKLDSRDWGWVAINIGMGIGAGIVFLPIQAGMVGLWVFLLSILIAYPALYTFQNLFMNSLITAKNCTDYTSAVSETLGKKFGILLGFIYFFMLVIWLFVYAQTITNDSATYLKRYGVTDGLLSQCSLYGLFIIILMVFLAFKSRKLLFRLSTFLVVIILSTLVVLSLMMVPYWNSNNIVPLGTFGGTVKEIIITLPFAMTSILFLQSLSPMATGLRGYYKDIKFAQAKGKKIMNTSFFLLGGIVFFFALSSTLSISNADAHEAMAKNISFMGIVADRFPSKVIPILSVALSIFAIMTSFFGVLLAFYESCMGLVSNIFLKGKSPEEVNSKNLSKYVIVFIVFFAWCSILLNLPIMWFTSISSPVFGIIGCFIPVLLVYKNENLRMYRGFRLYVILFTGILLFISPFLAFI